MRKLMTGVLCALSMVSFAADAEAIVIGLTPTSLSAAVGDGFDVDLTVDGLGNGTAPSLGAFDVNVSFDTAVLAFVGASFGPSLGDAFLGEAVTEVDASVPGVVNLFEVSFLEEDAATCVFCLPPFLNDIQTDSFVLATLSFTALAVGTSDLVPTGAILSDAAGISLADPTIASATFSISEPSALALLLAGLAGLAVVARWQRARVPPCGGPWETAAQIRRP